MENRVTPCSNFIVNYNGFTSDAQTAFQFAVDIWSNLLTSSVDIRVNANFGPLDPGVLGGAGPNGFLGFSDGLGGPVTFFARPLAEALLELETTDTMFTSDISDDENPSNDINATFSSSVNFYFGTDGNTPEGEIDFVTVVLHELGHGLGILGFGSVPTENGVPSPNPPVVGQINPNGSPSIWDEFIENGAGTSILTFDDPSAALLNQFQSNNLFSNSPTAVISNAGNEPKIYAPGVFSPGSSYSHWDEDTFTDSATALMTPFVGSGEAIHDPGNITLGFMEDMGWALCQGTLSSNDFALENIRISPNPFTESLNINLPSEVANQEFDVTIVDINGRIVSNSSESSNGEIIVSNLNNLKSALYFLTIQSKTSDLSITKKIVKQ